MAAKRYFLDETGLAYLVGRLLEKFGLTIDGRLVTLINDESTNDEIPTAKAVYSLLQSAMSEITTLSYELVVGDPPELPTTGEAGKIYLMPTEEGNVYVQWIYVNDQWLELGSTDVDLSNYWDKDELEPISNADINDIVEDAFGGSGSSEPEPEPEP